MALFTTTVDGAECLVVSGEILLDAEPYPRGSWLRFPAGKHPDIVTGEQGATIYLKTGRLGRTTMPV